MQILMYKWRAYNYKDIYHTFLSMGHTVDVIEQTLKSYDEDEIFKVLLEHKLMEKKYDFVFTVNYFAIIATVCEQNKTKYVAWSCDNPLISMYHKSIFSPYNYLFLFDKTNYYEFKGMGVPHVYYLPLCVNEKRLSHLIMSAQDLKAYENEIAFVGSLYERNTYDKIKPVFPPYLKGYLKGVIQAQCSVSGGNIVEEMLTPEILEEIAKYFELQKSKDSFSDLGLIFSTTVLGFKIAKKQREERLIALAKKAPVSIYTNSDTSKFIRIQNKGSLDYWTQMPKVFSQTKINLNFTIPNIKTGIPLRAFDIMGSGGFLLTNYQPELLDFFEDGKDLVCFDGEKDMVDKALYYLSNEKERIWIAENGKEKVKQFHTFEKRIETMLKMIETDCETFSLK